MSFGGPGETQGGPGEGYMRKKTRKHENMKT